jgi:DNA invertase Pin-like site-specific DNA recombinase
MSNGQVVGYVRVSTVDQNTERQLDGITLDKVFTDHASGKDTDRPQFQAMLSHVRDGDELVVHSMDRLSRSTVDMLNTVESLTKRGVTVRFVKESLTFGDTANPCNELMLTIMAAIAQFERTMIRERQREGIAIARRAGKYKGRKHALSQANAVDVLARLARGESATALADEYGVSRATVYNAKQRITELST